MKILVIDDTQVHLTAALQTLQGHDVTTCSSHDEATELLYKRQGVQYWDAVLCDLLMPAGKNAQGPEGKKLVGQEMPIGWALVLHAVLSGAKYVAVVTDMNHHNHPASALLDGLGGHVFNIDEAKCLMTNRLYLVGIAGTESACTECHGIGRDSNPQYACRHCEGFSQKGKDWGRILRQLVGGLSDEQMDETRPPRDTRFR